MAESFPFIIGSGRSGTTLLRAMLDTHPEMAIPFESYFTGELATVRDRFEKAGGFDSEALMADLFNYDRFQRWDVPEERVRERLRADAPADYPAAMRSVYGLYAELQGKSRYGDKTPRYVEYVDILAEAFPEARFVHIIRDGRNVACSYLDAEWGPGSLEDAAYKWMYRVEAGRKSGRALGPGRYMEIHYEALVDDPEDEVTRVCEFIDLDFRPEMMRYFERAESIRKGARYPHRHQHLSKPPTKNLRDWRTQLSESDVATFEGIAGGLLADLGYESSGTAVTSG